MREKRPRLARLQQPGNVIDKLRPAPNLPRHDYIALLAAFRLSAHTSITHFTDSKATMNILVIDIGGTNVKIWTSGEEEKLKFPSGKDLTPDGLIEKVRDVTADWQIDRVSIGYPGDVVHGHPIAEPWNLGDGWVDFDYASSFKCPVRIMNDACMQALGSYEGGRMLYLGVFIFDGTIIPLSLGHVLLHGKETVEQCVNRVAMEKDIDRWKKRVGEAAITFKNAFQAEYVVIGGGNAKKLEEMPEGSRRGGNHNAYFGGLRMWEDVKA
jgi:polyphosphate glucokinase